ncbi:MAG TPA: response regulator transcription factor [Oscillatoriales cyanobacterium M59_W2019_021]|nr:MAG: DNA-binding response regulator [Cyanobacteria bacterium J055]HIK30318.1 response regulator transcription factor [Oscillatoriales cyanobacterium M4454_W2019_049]HIK49792.1 response regulator transcription factor [Oscillatoriales cyanobacterium M59_W2019_021]
MSKIRVVLIEDHDLTRIGLRAALKQVENIEIVGDAATGRQGLQVLQQTKPDVALVDIGLPDMDGIELTRQLEEWQGDTPVESLRERKDAQTRILMLTMHSDENAVLAAFAAGADSYCLKDVSLENLVQAIELTHQGDAWIDPAIARIVLKQARTQETAAAQPEAPSTEKKTEIGALEPEYQKVLEAYPLTERELEVLELIVSGASNAAIAEKLHITVGTVKTHVRNILSKLCADDRTQAAVRALRSGLVG